jgi:dipeptidyl aminopeptidase/acylaminoacyl peptidase
MPPSRRPMQPEDIRRQVVLEEHDLSPDGSFAIVVRRFVRADEYRSELWRVPTGAARGRARRLTSGKVRDTRPRISPDGRRVAFLRRRLDGRERPGRLLVLDLARPNTEPIPVTPEKLGAAEAEWSPDGRRLAFTAEVDPPRFIVGPASALGKEAMGRRIRRIDWRMDEVGHVDRWSHLFVVEARRGATPIQLTEGDWGVQHPAWSPDGREIAFAADRTADADLAPCESVWAVASDASTATSEPRPVLALGGWANRPAWSPDGRFVVAVGVAEDGAPDEIAPGLFVGPPDGSSPPWPLAAALDRPIGQWTDTDLTGWMVSARGGPAWVAPDRIVAVVSDRGRSAPRAFPVDPATGRPTGDPDLLVEGDVVTESLAATAGSVTVLATEGSRALELYEATDGRLRRRTTQGSAWQARVVVPEMRLLAAPGPGGPVETWVASPPGAGDTPLPTVVDVHGGPLGAWAPAPAIETHLLVGRGYRVVLPNIRGSATYGRDWIEPQLGDWGGVDAADVHAAVDHVVDLGLADPDRLGVLGLSYGGFMVHWLVATSDRFKAAVSENGVANQVSAWANSDTGVIYDRAARLGDVFSKEGVDKLWRQSPLAHVSNVRTPLLMFQGEADRRCPPADNEQFFVALRALRREVEYVLYPEEFHTFATTGRPDRRIDRMTRMLDWFDRFLRA